MRLIIISGLSGSGKSVALSTLEDTGFYCIDNLPVDLLEAFGRHITSTRETTGLSDRYAVGVDARNRSEDLARFPAILESLRTAGIDCEILFLDAERDTLLKRFSETRRRHPLSDRQTALDEAIDSERRLLEPLLERADLTIDTTRTTVHELRDLVRDRLVRAPYELSLMFESFGYKHGLPADADFVFDARCLANPHWKSELRPFTGRDEPVQAFLEAQDEVGAYYEQLREFLGHWIPRFQQENRSYLTVAIGCTGGQHRSVYLAERLYRQFSAELANVRVRHRELP